MMYKNHEIIFDPVKGFWQCEINGQMYGDRNPNFINNEAGAMYVATAVLDELFVHAKNGTL